MSFVLTFLEYRNAVKLPGHPAMMEQARRGFPERKYRLDCAPSYVAQAET
jgi:hypothetical protein